MVEAEQPRRSHHMLIPTCLNQAFIPPPSADLYPSTANPDLDPSNAHRGLYFPVPSRVRSSALSTFHYFPATPKPVTPEQNTMCSSGFINPTVTNANVTDAYHEYKNSFHRFKFVKSQAENHQVGMYNADFNVNYPGLNFANHCKHSNMYHPQSLNSIPVQSTSVNGSTTYSFGGHSDLGVAMERTRTNETQFLKSKDTVLFEQHNDPERNKNENQCSIPPVIEEDSWMPKIESVVSLSGSLAVNEASNEESKLKKGRRKTRKGRKKESRNWGRVRPVRPAKKKRNDRRRKRRVGINQNLQQPISILSPACSRKAFGKIRVLR